MSWTPVEKDLPQKGDVVLATVELIETHKRFVVTCEYNWKMDTVTGEIMGPSTFMCYSRDETGDTSYDYDNKTDSRVIAWQPCPKPYHRLNVIVAGSRTFDDYKLLCEKLDKVFEKVKPTAILCGEARGADALGKKYAQAHGIPVLSFPADWDTYGKQAGYLRNEKMAENADALVAFWNGSSAGTKHMITIAKKKGLRTRIINYEGGS